MNTSTALAVSAAASFVVWSLLGLVLAVAAGMSWLWARRAYQVWRRVHRSHHDKMLAVVTGLFLGAMLSQMLELLLS